MSIYKKHVFVCENSRSPDHPLGSCAAKGAEDITQTLKQYCREARIQGKVRINKAGCLGQCAQGPVLVIYPEGTWCTQVQLEQCKQIFNSHISTEHEKSS